MNRATGIKDVTGREIFEGDVILFNRCFSIGKKKFETKSGWDWEQITGVVSFSNGCFFLSQAKLSPSCSQMSFMWGESYALHTLIEEEIENGNKYEFFILS